MWFNTVCICYVRYGVIYYMVDASAALYDTVSPVGCVAVSYVERMVVASVLCSELHEDYNVPKAPSNTVCIQFSTASNSGPTPCGKRRFRRVQMRLSGEMSAKLLSDRTP